MRKSENRIFALACRAREPPCWSSSACSIVMSTTTPGGKTLSAAELKPLIHREVRVLQSLGRGPRDNEVKQTLKKWRFRPNSVAQVRVPGYDKRTR